MADTVNVLGAWRAAMARHGRLDAQQLDELEAHLRDEMDHLAAGELDEEERLLVASHRLGEPAELGREYERVTPLRSWRGPASWAAAGVTWTLGVQALLALAVPIGGVVSARLGLPPAYLNLWAIIACVGGPLVTFAAVASWMCHVPADHRWSRRALLATAALMVSVCLASGPLHRLVDGAAWWKRIEPAAWQALQATWHWSGQLGLLIVGMVAMVVLAGHQLAERRRGAS